MALERSADPRKRIMVNQYNHRHAIPEEDDIIQPEVRAVKQRQLEINLACPIQ